MGALMDLQAARTRVTLAADVTLERFVACVDQLVGFQMAFCDESFVTAFIGAFEGTLASL